LTLAWHPPCQVDIESEMAEVPARRRRQQIKECNQMVWTNPDNPFLWNAWRSLREAQGQTQGLLRGMGVTSPLAVAVPINVYRSEHELVLRAQVPGYRSEDIDIDLEADVLTLAGRQAEGGGHTDFERRLRVPFLPNVDGVRAALTDGVLEIHVPRAEEDKPKRITIEA
jgi:HSP20 family protein